MLIRVCLILFLQLSFLMNITFAQGVTISIPTEVKIDGPFMTLGEVADIKGDDLEWINRLKQLKIGSAATPGGYMVLTKELLGVRLVTTGFDLKDINWNVPDRVTVTTNSQTIQGQMIIDKGLKSIKEQIGPEISNMDISISPIGNCQDILAPVGNFVLTGSLPYGIRYNTPTTVHMVLTINGQVFTTMNLRFDVKSYRQVAVAATQISQGEVLTKENLRYERMDTARLGNSYFSDMEKLVGLETRRPLPPGMVVTSLMVNRPVLIKRGSLVTIIARIGGMEVSVYGKAMQDGYEGQLIRVQNSTSNKFLSAKVLDESTVQALTYNTKVY